MRSAVPALLVLLVATPALAARETNRVDAKSVWLPYDFSPITDAERALASVAFAPGAPAVILLEARQDEWTGMDRRIHYHRRVKVLTKDGVDLVGNTTYRLLGDWRLKTVKARTVLADGTIVDASDGLHVNASDGDGELKEIRVAFPRVEPGAILDLVVDMMTTSYTLRPWTIDRELPVVESRLVFLPPLDLRFRTAIMRAPQEQSQPRQFPMRGVTGYCWSFRDRPALPDLPNMPPDDDVAGQLVLILDSISSGGAVIGVADSWKTWLGYTQGEWEQWLRKKSPQAQALAASACAGKTTAREKAEAIRRALAPKLRSDYDWWWPQEDSVEDVLAQGHGSSADVAGVAIACLRAAGVTAWPAAVRRRDEGSVPADVPIPAMFGHALVKVEEGEASFWFDPTDAKTAGSPSWDTSGITAAVFKKGAAAPEAIPDFTADQNTISRSADARLSADGRLDATVTVSYIGIAADFMRDALAGLPAEARQALVRDEVLERLPGADVKVEEVKGLDAADDMLEVRYSVSAPGHGLVAGKRLLVNPLVGDRVTTTDWTAETRTLPLHLGGAFQEEDTIRLAFPEGISAVQLRDGQRYNAPPVGMYDVSFEPAKDGRSVVVRRKRRMDMYAFGADSYPQMRQWHHDMAAMDDRSIALTFP